MSVNMVRIAWSEKINNVAAGGISSSHWISYSAYAMARPKNGSEQKHLKTLVSHIGMVCVGGECVCCVC